MTVSSTRSSGWLGIISVGFVIAIGCDRGVDRRAFSEIASRAPEEVLAKARISLHAQIGSLDGWDEFGRIHDVAIHPSDTLLAVSDGATCSIKFIRIDAISSVINSGGEVGTCGEGPQEFLEPRGMTFYGDSLLVFDAKRASFAVIAPNRRVVRRFKSEIIGRNSRSLSNLSALTDSTVLASRYLRSPIRTTEDARLLAEIHISDGRMIRQFLEDSPVSLQNPSPSQGRRVLACAFSGAGKPLIAIANQWMAQTVVLEASGAVTKSAVRASWDLTPDWYVLHPNLADPRTLRPPGPGGDIACTADRAVFSYRTASASGVERARIIIVDSAGVILAVEDATSPALPAIGATILRSGGTRLIAGSDSRGGDFPRVLLYKIEDLGGVKASDR